MSALAQSERREKDLRRVYKPSDNVLRNIIYSREPELIASGPAGTGKSRGFLEKIFLTMCKYPICRVLIFRKIKATLNNTGLVTWEKHVLPSELRIRRQSKLDRYVLPNGSVMDIAGMDDPEKIKSGEWDMAFGQEITECDEEDWDLVSSRLRNGVVPYQMLMGDCNPSHPKHWVRLRCLQPHPDPDVRAVNPLATRAKMVEILHRDNPRLWDERNKCWTEYGKQYIARLKTMQGTNYLRLYKGLWVAAEGVVYEHYRDETHKLPKDWRPQPDWKRVWSIDFGFTAPFVWQEWCVATDNEDPKVPKGSMVLYREIYQTRTLNEDHAAHMLRLMEVYPYAVVCDHDAESRAVLEKHLGMNTVAAYKIIKDGVQFVQERMRNDVRLPRIYIRDGARVHDADPFLVESKKPLCTEEELPGYSWPKVKEERLSTVAGMKKAETPEQVDDHGCDAMRYAVCYVDHTGMSDGVFF